MSLGFGQLARYAERLSARDDRDLVERVGVRREMGDRRMARLVDREPAPLLRLDREGAYAAHHELVAHLVQLRLGYRG